MTRAFVIEHAGPAISVQDLGRAGQLGIGVSRGGAADRRAFLDGVALLQQPANTAALEMAGLGGRFRFTAPTRFALSGAAMPATLDGSPLEWNASHLAGAGSVLQIAAADDGIYAYLSFGGGIVSDIELGGRGLHGIAGLGQPISAGDSLPLGPDPVLQTAPMRLPAPASDTGPLRVMPGPQTALFSDNVRDTFQATTFTKSSRANRQGVRLDHDGAPFATDGQLNLVSDFISEGDIQMTGDGTPYVLLAECQTMGGYPRIGTVLPADLPRVAQAVPGAKLNFRFVTLDEAEKAFESDEAYLARRTKALQPRTRDPREMADLLSYELIDRPPDDITDH